MISIIGRKNLKGILVDPHIKLEQIMKTKEDNKK